jgi:hypothetical protein
MWCVGMAQNLLRGKKRLPCHKGFKNAAERGLKVHVNPPDFPGEIKGLCDNPHKRKDYCNFYWNPLERLQESKHKILLVYVKICSFHQNKKAWFPVELLGIFICAYFTRIITFFFILVTAFLIWKRVM